MNLSAFVAQRVAFQSKNSFSALIIRIAIAAVALSVAIMICATALVSGFKQTISDKIFGFWGHVHITNYDSNNSFESIPISVRQSFYPSLDTLGRIDYIATHNFLGYEWRTNERTKGGVRRVQMFANKAGIIKTQTQLEGIVLKGIGADYDWHFLRQFLVAGDTLALPNWRFIPDYLAGKYPVLANEKQDSTRNRFDAIVPNAPPLLAQAQQKAEADSVYNALADTAVSNKIIISESTAHRLKITVGDKFTVHFVEGDNQRVRKFTVSGIYKTGLEEYDRKFALVDIRQIQQLNNWRPYQVSGFEVFLDNIADIDPMGQYIYYQQTGSDLYAQTIKERYPNIFGWLDLQDVNERFILLLMLIVSVINMTTALMILILERTNMIGTLKALGGTNWVIQKMFLHYAAIIVGRGLLWGNIIGIGLCLAQKYGQIIRLDESAYYVSVAPIHLDFLTILLLNIGTLAITLLVLLVPSMLVARISPVKAIRFK
jgi:lipoprotein-releasing system permease protein